MVAENKLFHIKQINNLKTHSYTKCLITINCTTREPAGKAPPGPPKSESLWTERCEQRPVFSSSGTGTRFCKATCKPQVGLPGGLARTYKPFCIFNDQAGDWTTAPGGRGKPPRSPQKSEANQGLGGGTRRLGGRLRKCPPSMTLGRQHWGCFGGRAWGLRDRQCSLRGGLGSQGKGRIPWGWLGVEQGGGPR